jgi:hypothetical protein
MRKRERGRGREDWGASCGIDGERRGGEEGKAADGTGTEFLKRMGKAKCDAMRCDAMRREERRWRERERGVRAIT